MSDNLEILMEDWMPANKYKIDENVAELEVKNYQALLDVNKGIHSQLVNLKLDLNLALEKCERKLTVIEKNLQRLTADSRKNMMCTPGIPYFKDRHYFFAPKNEDEILKESRNELQMVNLPKPTDWTLEDKEMLENMANAEIEKLEKEALVEAGNEKIKRARYNEPAKKKEPDWLKISSQNYRYPHSPLDCRVMWNVFLRNDINKRRWTVKEDAKLKKLVLKYKLQNWEKISDQLGTKRTAYQCFVRYNTIKKLPKIQNCNWSKKEDERLAKLVEIHRIGDYIPWGDVSNWMPNRTKQQIYFRWAYSIAPHLCKGRFTRKEDKMLLDGISKFGTNFHKISAVLMPHRSTVQLHYRHETLMLKGMENWNRWTMAEDTQLLCSFQLLGPNWSAIAKQFRQKKNRTQLRHRCAALKKYTQRGVSLLDLHRDEALKKEGDFTLLTKNEQQDNKDTFRRHIDDDDSSIEQRLIEYFCWNLCKQEDSQRESFPPDVDNLYKTLKRLNAVLLMPDEDIEKLNDKQREIAYALKDHARERRDEEKRTAEVERCRLRMFACSENKENPEEASPHFIPPLPFDMQEQKSKRSKVETHIIDYSLDRSHNFLFETPSVFDTPDYVISYIGEENRELYKILAPYGAIDDSSLYSKGHLPTDQSNVCMTPRKSNDDAERDASERSSDQGATNCDSRISFCNELTQNTDVIHASHATLSSFKNLTWLKYLRENSDLNNLMLIQLNKFHKTFAVLETRLEKLFKYPIGLSRINAVRGHMTSSFSFIDFDPKDTEDKSISNVKKKKVREILGANLVDENQFLRLT